MAGKKDKYACFQWIRDIREKMSKEMEHMTPEEQVAYIRAGAEKALSQMPKYSLEEADRRRQASLHPEAAPAFLPKAKPAKKPVKQRKAAKRLTHA